ncbi:hypothetical protein GF323_05055 [Candidatus Woesearchaeota archaeon]|nr:hypothetical protein [Candidatus Woesearchaeota archaeon]
MSRVNLRPLDEKIVASLHEFFTGPNYRLPSREDSGYMANLHQFMGHSRKILTNAMKLQLASLDKILDADKLEFLIDAHGETRSNAKKVLTGHSGGALNEVGISRANGFYSPDYKPQIIVSSDSARGIHHTFAKYFPDKLSELDNLVDATPSTLDENWGIIARDVQLAWVDKAISYGIIPTPLLRAQFYGLMELFPVDGISKKIAQLKNGHFQEPDPDAIRQVIQKHEQLMNEYFEKQKYRLKMLADGSDIDFKLQSLRQALGRRTDPKYHMQDEDGMQLTEQRIDLLKRVDYVMDILSPENQMIEYVLGKRIQLVSHSGTLDALFEHLRRYDEPENMHLLKRKKPNPRGESILVTMDVPNLEVSLKEPALDNGALIKGGRESSDICVQDITWHEHGQMLPPLDNGGTDEVDIKKSLKTPTIITFRYLNDPAPLEDAVQRTQKEIKAFRSASPDEKIQAGNGIIPAEFYVLERQEGKAEGRKQRFALDTIISDPDNYLILANCGLGKTMFSLDLASRLLAQDTYVPVLVRLRSVKPALELEKRRDGRDEYTLLKGILTSDISYLADETLDTFKRQGKKFAFIWDGYDELDSSLKDLATIGALINDVGSMGKVVLTSRYEQFSPLKTGNISMADVTTVNIDPDAIVRNLGPYLDARIGDENKKTDIYEFIQRQSEEIKKNWLMVYFITNIYLKEPEALDLSSEISQPDIMGRGIEWFVWDHATRRNPVLYSPPIRLPDDTDEAYDARRRTHMLQRKIAYTREIMPALRRVAAYMTVMDRPVITPDELQMVLDNRWSLADEIRKRKKSG